VSDVLDAPEPWVLRESTVDIDSLKRTESLFALANGHLGLRGNLDEGEPRVSVGTYLNGLYESFPLEYGERGYGFAEDGQTVVNCPDGKVIRLLVENEPVDIERGTVLAHERSLDLRSGVLSREMEWRSSWGDHIRLRSKRLVSFVQRSVAAIAFEVEAVDRPLRVALQSVLSAGEVAAAGQADPRAGRDLGDILVGRLTIAHDGRAVMAHSTRRTELTVASGMDHVIEAPDHARQHTEALDDVARHTVSVRLEPGQVLRVEKFLAYHWSSRQTVDWLVDQVSASLENALAEGWDGLAKQQRAFLDDWWTRADIEVDGDDELQQALRFALFHLIQAGARIEGRAIGAKGLTGTGYDGHAFWDTESFVLQVLTYLQPRAARDALHWRHSILPLARERAATLARAPRRSACAAPCCRGGPSTARSARATGPPASPPCTSTPTWPTRCAATCWRPVTPPSRPGRGSSCWWSRRACGSGWVPTTVTTASASRA
jgi:alpha,alpha-trehalose phosphorylase